MEDFDSRWACPKCGSKDVEIALPTWYREDKGGSLTVAPEQDGTEILYWICNTCAASDQGYPVDLLKED